ncbi:hypothetical protein ENSA5_61240 [Enhygromyxa salina]|uniref:Uncharacterized protein n=1 Tax=Enhygromyxa salina TaxID=215803 RepID=A0A2S9XD56_9BACT|nr:hypothetical protein [Enhygromyxa salina]PRP90804.1 hypothetical protein ENSA5_61240 [Enhygromyxa salina]
MSPAAEQERDGAIESAKQVRRDAEALDEEEERLETARRGIAAELDAVQLLHVEAVQQHEQDSARFARYKDALAQAKTISTEECESLDETPLSTLTTLYEELAQFERESARDEAIEQLESCRKKTAQRMKKLARSGPSDSEIKQAIIQDSISRTPGNCPCPYHAASNGSRCGRRSAYSKYGGEYVTCYAQQVSNEEVQEYRSRLVADPLLMRQDDFADPWTTAAGDRPVPVEPSPVPPMAPEMGARVAELEAEIQKVDVELAALSAKKTDLLGKVGSAEGELARLDQRELKRQRQWHARAKQHAQNTQVAGVVLLITGVLGAVAGAYGYYEQPTTRTALAQERDAQALNEELGLPTDTSKVQDLEDQLARQETLGPVGLAVGIPLITLGVLFIFAADKRKKTLERMSLSAGRLQWRF